MFLLRSSKVLPVVGTTVALVLSLSLAHQALAQSVVTDYEKIAEGGNIGFTFREVGLASINQGGRVAFQGQDAAHFVGIYTNLGGIAASNTTVASPSVVGGGQPSSLSINASGTVAYTVLDLSVNKPKVYSGNGGALTWVSNPATAPTLPNFTALGNFVTINNAGIVAYGATSFDSGTGQNGTYIGVTQGGTFVPVAQASVPGTLNGISFNNFTNVSNNNAGQTAYFFNSTSNRGFIYRHNADNSVTSIASLIQPQTTLGMNDSGFVTYTGLNNTSLLLSNGIMTITIGTSTTLDPVSGLPLNSFANLAAGSSDYISVNNLNQVAFRAGGVGGGAPNGIYVGDGSKVLTVAQVGGALFGSTITGLGLSSQAINDLGQVVFTATLADGRTEIVRGTLPGVVTVPESGTLGLLFLGVFSLTGVRVRRATMRRH